MLAIDPKVSNITNVSPIDPTSVCVYTRELKQATFLSTRTAPGSKLRRYRWRMMASAVLV